MRIGVVGGRLQGLEVVYLAKKAGYHTLVIDKSGDVPAAGICDRFVRHEFFRECFVPDECSNVDLIILAIEDREVLLLAVQFVPGQVLCPGQPVGETYSSGEFSDRWVVVEHIQAGPDRIRFLGEHIMGLVGPLGLESGFFGCHEALTNYGPGRSCWVATLIFCADNQKDLAAARNTCYKQIRKKSAPIRKKCRESTKVHAGPGSASKKKFWTREPQS
ncbi:MAG: hypothetical protein R6V15_05640 [Desulfotignum sp.]